MRIKNHDTPTIPVFDHNTSGKLDFRESIIRRIKKRVGSSALVDPDIAFESPVSGLPKSQEALQRELAEFREAERSLGVPE